MNRPSLRSLLSFSFNFYCTTTQRIIKGSSILAVLKINMWPVLKEFLVSATCVLVCLQSMWTFK